MPDPVVPLEYALYGHPDSPTFWEMHCDELVKNQDFAAYGPEWPLVYYHSELQLMLSIYVDDFKLSEPKENLAKGWALLKKGCHVHTAYLPKKRTFHYAVGLE